MTMTIVERKRIQYTAGARFGNHCAHVRDQLQLLDCFYQDRLWVKQDSHVNCMLDAVDDYLSSACGYVLMDVACDAEYDQPEVTPAQAAMIHASNILLTTDL